MFREITLRQQDFSRRRRAGQYRGSRRRCRVAIRDQHPGLNQLERSLGIRLFDRIGKRLALNADGKALLPKALGILDNARQLESGRVCRARSSCVCTRAPAIGNYCGAAASRGLPAGMSAGAVEARIGSTLEVIRAVRVLFRTRIDRGTVPGERSRGEPVDSRRAGGGRSSPPHPLIRAAVARSRSPSSPGAPTMRALREEGSGTREAVDLAVLPHIHSFGESTRSPGGSGHQERRRLRTRRGLSRWVVDDLVRARRLVILDARLPVLGRRLSIIWRREDPVGGPRPVHRALPGPGRTRRAYRRSADLGQA